MLSRLSQKFKKKAPRRQWSPPPASKTINTPQPEEEDNDDIVATLLRALPEVGEHVNEGTQWTLWSSILPREIVFQIIDDEFHTDIPTLRNLSLTCRLIHLHARTHLLRHITELRCGTPRTSNIKQFLRLLHQSPDILGLIQSLKIAITTASHPSISFQQDNTERACICFLMKQSLPNLTSLRLTLNLSGSSTYSLEPSFSLYTSLISILGNPKLQHLTLRGSDAFWTRLLTFAPSVVDLNIRNLQQNYGDVAMTRIQPITLTICDPTPISSFLDPNYADLSQVTTFRFFGANRSFIAPYISQLSSTLTRLEMYIYWGSENSVSDAALNLSSLRALQHLTASIHVYISRGALHYDSNIRFRWLTNTLASLPNPCAVESITILFGCNVLHHCQSFDWQGFDQSVFGLRQKWGGLKTLDMVFFLDYNRDLDILGTQFADEVLPGALRNFSGTNACLSARFETGKTIHSYLPVGVL